MNNTNEIFTRKHFLAGLLVGTLDITVAGIQFYIKTGKSPTGVLRYVASGAFGPEAFSGSSVMLLWGLIFHFMIAMTFTFLFFFLVENLPILSRQKIPFAIIYGIFMWAAVRFIVIPFSRITPPAFNLKNIAIAVSILIICISVPLTIIAEKKRVS